MNRDDFRRYMLLEKKEESGGSLYRVLDVGDRLLVMDCKKKTMPVWKDYEEFEDYIITSEAGACNKADVSLEDLEAEERCVAL